MRRDLIDIVCCPEDKARLVIEDAKLDDHGDVLAGTLRCTQCGFGYPVEAGIPNLLPPQYHVPREGKDRSRTHAKVAQASEAAEPGDAAATGREALAGNEE